MNLIKPSTNAQITKALIAAETRHNRQNAIGTLAKTSMETSG